MELRPKNFDISTPPVILTTCYPALYREPTIGLYYTTGYSNNVERVATVLALPEICAMANADCSAKVVSAV